MHKAQGGGILVALALITSPGVQRIVGAQGVPNPYRIVEGWAQLPNAGRWGRSARSRSIRTAKRGHLVVKFSPAGKVLMTLGTPGQEGSGPDHFTSPSDVVVGAGRRRLRRRRPH